MKNKQGADRKRLLILIHGTFARKAKWTLEGSFFRQNLIKLCKFPSVVETFEWTGDNSHEARLTAANDLAERIRQLTAKFPDSLRHIIAHSHGGNVALYALRNHDLRKKIASVVCLDTPFVGCVARRIKYLRFGLHAFLWTMVVAPLLVAEVLAYLGFSHPTLLHRASPWLTGFTWTWFFLLIISYSRFERLVHSLFRRQGEISSRLKLPESTKVPILCIKVRRGEASAYLAFLGRIAEAPYLLWNPVWFVFLYSVTFALLGFFYRSGPFTSKKLPIVFWVLWPIAALVFSFLSVCLTELAMLFVPKVVRAHPLGWGWEDFIDNFLVHLSVEKTPPRSNRCVIREYSVGGFGLKHSLVYSDLTVIQDVAAWLSDDDSL